MHWLAQWIWLDQPDRHPYNQTVVARKTFDVPHYVSASLAITADSAYRLFINGTWVADGPGRSWPQHYQYDVVNVTPYLRVGKNVVVIVATHVGQTMCPQLPQEAGLLAQLDITVQGGRAFSVMTDDSWRMVESSGHVRATPLVSMQMGAAEWYDARLACSGASRADYDDSAWPHARSYYAVEEGPWQNLHPRDVPFLTREPVLPAQVRGMLVVRGGEHTEGLDLQRLYDPQQRLAHDGHIAGLAATVVVAEAAHQVRVTHNLAGAGRLYCNGQCVVDKTLLLRTGENLLVLAVQADEGDGICQAGLVFNAWEGLALRHPADAHAETPWLWIDPAAPATSTVQNSQLTPGVELERLTALPDATALCAAAVWRTIPAVCRLYDSYLPFLTREVVYDAAGFVSEPQHLVHADSERVTRIQPAPTGDIELCLDFGKEVVGWVEFTLDAPAGVCVDAHLIEYRKGETLQHTAMHNGFRYITREGLNHWISLRRRAGRYLFLTLRGLSGPVTLHAVRLLHATYPVVERGAFKCNDPILNRIWQMSAYTLRLCMEDCYISSPLSAQALWLGEARNAALYNHIVFGAYDLTLRCLTLGAQSLEQLPLAESPLPRGCRQVVPVWTFLWGINVWEYYVATGDYAGLARLYPAVIQNVLNAHRHCIDHGLFVMPTGQYSDRPTADIADDTVLQNSLFLVGAIDAARQCCLVLGEGDGEWLDDFATALRQAIVARWQPATEMYPDSLHTDGTRTTARSQHTSVLAVLYDVLPPELEEMAYRHLLDPPAEMGRVATPFALQFVLEALERAGDCASALALIRANWEPMLRHGATTCWETLPTDDNDELPQHHCHVLSCAPLYLCARTILGVVPSEPGAAAVRISPHLLDLEWAEGVYVTPRGDIRVTWHHNGTALVITVQAPPQIAWCVVPNRSWDGINRLVVNGEDLGETLLDDEVPVLK